MEQLQLATAEEPTEPAFWLKLAALQAVTTSGGSHAEKALQNIPGNPQILEVMGLMRLAQNRYKQAAEFLQQAYDAAMADDPNEPMTPLFYYHIALASTHLGQTERAADWLERAMEMEPGILPLYMQRAITGTKSYRRNAAKVLRALAQEAGQKNASVLAHLAVLDVYQKKMAQAIQGFDEVPGAGANDPLQATALTPWFYFWFGVALDEAKQGERSVEMFEKCIELAPDYAEARNYLAYVWALQGIRLDEALRHIQVALSEDPYNAAFLDTLGWVYQMGEYEDASMCSSRRMSCAPTIRKSWTIWKRPAKNWAADSASPDDGSYFTTAPLDKSPSTVTKRRRSPLLAASSMPWLSTPRNLMGARLATTTTVFPIKSSGL